MPQPRTRLLAVDPGLLTGLVYVDISERMAPKPIASLEADTATFYRAVEDLVPKDAEHMIIVCENFIITQRTAKLSQAPWSLMGRGFMEYWAWKYSIPFVLQTPADAKDFSTDDKLKKAGFWHVGGEGHANDAFRHAMKYHADRSPRWTNTLTL